MEPLVREDPVRLGRYLLLGRLGAGGMGVVYLARSRADGRTVAVKAMRPAYADRPDFRRRFAREIGAAKRVDGRFTAAVVDADSEGRIPWLATVYVPGFSLAEAVERFGHLPEGPVRALARGLVGALRAIHAEGLVHRDLKPSNILLTADGPKVIDFGIAYDPEASAMTIPGSAMGTPAYMSPEQANGEVVGPASDVFSLGGVLVFAATGRGPFRDGDPGAVLFRLVHGEPDTEGVPPGLRGIVRACLAKDPRDRPPLDRVLEEVAEEADGRGPDGGGPGPGWLPPAVLHELLRKAALALDAERAGGPGRSGDGDGDDGGGGDGREGPGRAGGGGGDGRRGRDRGGRAPRGQGAAGSASGPGPDSSGPDDGSGADGGAGADGGRAGAGAGVPLHRLGDPARRRLLALTGAAALGGLYWWRTGGDLDEPWDRDLAAPSWQYTHGATLRTGVLAASSDAVYLGDLDDRIWRVERRAGGAAPVWDAALPGTPHAPVVLPQTVVVATQEGVVAALDRETGAQRWRHTTDGGLWRPARVGTSDVLAVAGDYGRVLEGLDLGSGKRLWRRTWERGMGWVRFVSGNQLLVYFASPGEARRLDSRTGETAVTEKNLRELPYGPLMAEDFTYYPTAAGVEASDNKLSKVTWTFTADTDDAVPTGAVVLVDGAVCFGYGEAVYAVDARSGRRRWKRGTRGTVVAAVTGRQGTVFAVTDDDTLHALDADSGRPAWTFTRDAMADAAPLVESERVFVVTGGRTLNALDVHGPRWKRW